LFECAPEHTSYAKSAQKQGVASTASRVRRTDIPFHDTPLPASSEHGTIAFVPSPYLGLEPGEVAERLLAVVARAAAGPMAIHVGDEVFGCRNVGVDLPRRRRSVAETRLLRLRVREALERDGVVLAESALAPRVPGDLTGSVRVREVAASHGDAAHMLRDSSLKGA